MSYIPQFVKGDSTKIANAIAAGIIAYPAYVYETDTGILDFIDSDNSINPIQSPSDICNVVTLNPAEADKDKLYIKDNVLYSFDGEKFYNQTVTADPELEAKVNNLDNILGEDLVNGAISLENYIKQYVSGGESTTLEWGDF